jgi:hypothetical protein
MQIEDHHKFPEFDHHFVSLTISAPHGFPRRALARPASHLEKCERRFGRTDVARLLFPSTKMWSMDLAISSRSTALDTIERTGFAMVISP